MIRFDLQIQLNHDHMICLSCMIRFPSVVRSSEDELEHFLNFLPGFFNVSKI